MTARAAIAAGSFALAIAGAGCGRRHPAAPAAGKPRLVVLIVIDQLPRWGFDARRPQFEHGLARLLREGTLLTGEYPYAITSTAPGHATLATGAPPSATGVVANIWYRRRRGAERLAETDDEAPLLPIGDRVAVGATGASSAA